MQNITSKPNQLFNYEGFSNTLRVGVLRNALLFCFFILFYGSIYGHNDLLFEDRNTTNKERFEAPMACNPPTASQNTTSSITETSARLNCSAAGSFRNFRIRASNASAWTYLAYTSASFLDVPGLNQNSTYQWQSRLYCNGQFSGWSTTESFTTIAAAVCPAPTASQLDTKNITETSARLLCVAVANYRNFRYRASNSSTWTNLTYQTSVYQPISGLSPGTTYIWQSKVLCSNWQWSGWSPTKSFTTTAVCTSPTAAQNTTSNITSTSAQLNCSAQGNLRYFRYRASNSSSWITTSYTASTNLIKTGLSSGTTYYWQSKVQCTNGQWSGWSPTESFTTLSSSCNPPTASQNTTTNITETSARLNCSTTGINKLYRYRADYTSIWTYSNNNANYHNISGLDPGTIYYWETKVQCANGVWSGWSATESFTTYDICEAPTTSDNYTSNITATSAKLNCNHLQEYVEFRYRKDITTPWISVYPTTGYSRDIYGLSLNTSYIWQSRLKCTNGLWSAWSATESFTTLAAGPCNAPAAYQNTTSNITKFSARMNCTATGIERDFRYRASTTSNWTNLSSTTYPYKYLYGLSPGTTYYWQSMIKCSNGQWSSWSSSETFTTLAGGSCNAPTSLQNSTSNITKSSARLNCSAPGTYRQFTYKKSSLSTWTFIHFSSSSYKNISVLSSGTSYQWKSRVYCSNGQWSAWSPIETFTTHSQFNGNQNTDNTTRKASKETTVEALSVSLAPNPQHLGLRTNLTITSNHKEEAILQITDLSGKIVRKEVVQLESGSNQIKLDRFEQAGIYLISIQSNTEISTAKLIISE